MAAISPAHRSDLVSPAWRLVGGRLNDAVGNEDLAAFLEEKHRPIIQIPGNHGSYPSFLHP